MKQILWYLILLHAGFDLISLTSLSAENSSSNPPKKIAMIGTGYVGLIEGAWLSEWGHEVICADIQSERIKNLQEGIIPIFEPGLSELIQKNQQEGRLTFTTDIALAIRSSDIILIAVGTPSASDGSTDLTALHAALETLIDNIDSPKLICIKSTVPVGTTRKVKEILSNKLKMNDLFELCFCPEFMRQGSAVTDFFYPYRLVIGVESLQGSKAMKELFAPLLDREIPLVETNFETAEAIKYGSNAFLAIKISFINEMGQFCQETGVDVVELARGIGLDKRIGSEFLKPGPGYGGSCIPKDTLSLLHQGVEHGLDLKLVTAALHANQTQQELMSQKLEKLLLGNLKDKYIAILGLAFKANTDDIRNSPAIPLIKHLVQAGAKVRAYDPEAIPTMKKLFPDISYGDSIQDTVHNADAVVVITEWIEFKEINLTELFQELKQPVLLDTRNLYNPSELERLGFQYDNTGRL